MAGFGNRLSDIRTYKAVGLKDTQIFTVNYEGRVMCGKYGQNVDPKDESRKNISSKCQTKTTDAANEPNSPPEEQNDGTNSRPETGEIYLTYDTLLSMVQVYFPQPKDRLIHADECSDYTFWRF